MFKKISSLVSVALSLAVFNPAAQAQSYPAGPVKLIVPYAPGAANDTLARITAEALSKRLGQSVIVENKPGAGAQIGINYLVKAPADGYTILYGERGGLSIQPALKTPAPHSLEKDFTFLARMAAAQYAMVVSSSLPVANYKEFIEYAAKNPGKVRHGQTGEGSLAHLASEEIAAQSKINFIQVPYKGMANVVNDLIAGHIDAALVSPSTISAYKNSNKIRILAMVSASRHPFLPDVPTVAELGFHEIVADNWYGIVGPANMPPAVTSRLISEFEALFNDPKFVARITDKGFVMAPLYGDAFKALAVSDSSNIRELGKKLNVKLD